MAILQAFSVPKRGLEPPRPCGHMTLNHARLPIPPLGLEGRQVNIGWRATQVFFCRIDGYHYCAYKRL